LLALWRTSRGDIYQFMKIVNAEELDSCNNTPTPA